MPKNRTKQRRNGSARPGGNNILMVLPDGDTTTLPGVARQHGWREPEEEWEVDATLIGHLFQTVASFRDVILEFQTRAEKPFGNQFNEVQKLVTITTLGRTLKPKEMQRVERVRNVFNQFYASQDRPNLQGSLPPKKHAELFSSLHLPTNDVPTYKGTFLTAQQLVKIAQEHADRVIPTKNSTGLTRNLHATVLKSTVSAPPGNGDRIVSSLIDALNAFLDSLGNVSIAKIDKSSAAQQSYFATWCTLKSAIQQYCPTYLPAATSVIDQLLEETGSLYIPITQALQTVVEDIGATDVSGDDVWGQLYREAVMAFEKADKSMLKTVLKRIVVSTIKRLETSNAHGKRLAVELKSESSKKLKIADNDHDDALLPREREQTLIHTWSTVSLDDTFKCTECGILRMGKGLGIDYFYCKKCNVCLAISLEGRHECIERNLESDCPICGDVFGSEETVAMKPCGHCIHYKCHQEHIQTSYQCPTCLKSLADMTDHVRRIDQALAQQQMPKEYANLVNQIYCNDCEKKSYAKFHFMYHKCADCFRYNTKVLKTLGSHQLPEGAKMAPVVVAEDLMEVEGGVSESIGGKGKEVVKSGEGGRRSGSGGAASAAAGGLVGAAAEEKKDEKEEAKEQFKEFEDAGGSAAGVGLGGARV
ncbi:hypothetical protein HK097_008302 [Rhizophlyctis rosea]|uniref:RING-type domain-containing protein n=1 Tax=Rhizophlyctis rosea TaxID=64517 RepID=A0AAD5SCQ0_9FUNG|nr:hypothetical protein HK097_008302 [Rhizophlyctis rosea]